MANTHPLTKVLSNFLVSFVIILSQNLKILKEPLKTKHPKFNIKNKIYKFCIRYLKSFIKPKNS
jgi:hypothetical protein